jgi:hypothetical protein
MFDHFATVSSDHRINETIVEGEHQSTHDITMNVPVASRAYNVCEQNSDALARSTYLADDAGVKPFS